MAAAKSVPRRFVVVATSAATLGAATTRLRAPYKALATIFRDPGDEEDGDGGKVTTAWLLEDASQAQHTFYVRDSQDEDDRAFHVDAFRGRPHYAWHIHGPSEAALGDFCRWLESEVRTYVRANGGRKLTAASRTAIQELVKSGKSVSDATSLAAEWEPALDETLFTWPIHGDVEA